MRGKFATLYVRLSAIHNTYSSTLLRACVGYMLYGGHTCDVVPISTSSFTHRRRHPH